jgi:hypothetical protein
MSIEFEEIKILVPKKLIKKRKHKDDNEWFKIFYYIDKKRTRAIVNKGVATSVLDIRKNTFYKVNNLCNTDLIWDYYRILKPSIANNKKIKQIAKLNLLKCNPTLHQKNARRRVDNSWKGIKIKHTMVDRTPITIHWD